MEFQNTSVITKNSEKFLASTIGDEMVMMNVETGDYIGLNPVGAFIWNLLDQPQPVEELIQKLCENFDGERNVIEKDVHVFLNRMNDESIILIDK